ncbi:hypothetical protein Mapa_001848 [Marchantia paleacea]|nr:hypothetical protein Mapa_001848 [Marchantia paleacea]
MCSFVPSHGAGQETEFRPRQRTQFWLLDLECAARSQHYWQGLLDALLLSLLLCPLLVHFSYIICTRTRGRDILKRCPLSTMASVLLRSLWRAPLSRSGGLYAGASYAISRFWLSSDVTKSQKPETKDEEFTLTVDRSGLSQHEDHVHKVSGRESMSAMSKHLDAIIRFRGGPISVAEYMEEILTNPTAGFYMNRDVFGAGGDFVTSPDISQMFGELIGVWSTCLWHQMGRPKEVALVELGPGRGTLMADLIRGTSKFEDFTSSISIHLVECSPTLRKLQEATLECVPCDESPEKKRSKLSGSLVSWYMDLLEVPRGVPTIIIAHEFFDALPVHQFQKTPRGWCEKLVDVGESPCEPFRYVLSPRPTPASKLYLSKRLQWASEEEKSNLEHVEVCPESFRYTGSISRRISEDGGAALIIDYGDDKIITDSLQAIRKHKFTSVLHDPGSADLSAHVDFGAIKHAATEAAANGVAVYGPITQSKFLGMLGINFRLEALLNNASEEQAEALQLGYWRLVGEGPAPWVEGEEDESSQTGMGTQYKALAIVNSSLGAPIGFQ